MLSSFDAEELELTKGGTSRRPPAKSRHHEIESYRPISMNS
jgi:hypothetical protein